MSKNGEIWSEDLWKWLYILPESGQKSLGQSFLKDCGCPEGKALIFLCSVQRKNMEFQLTGRSDRYFQAPSAGLENRQNSRVSEKPPEIGSHKSLGSNPF